MEQVCFGCGNCKGPQYTVGPIVHVGTIAPTVYCGTPVHCGSHSLSTTAPTVYATASHQSTMLHGVWIRES